METQQQSNKQTMISRVIDKDEGACSDDSGSNNIDNIVLLEESLNKQDVDGDHYMEYNDSRAEYSNPQEKEEHIYQEQDNDSDDESVDENDDDDDDDENNEDKYEGDKVADEKEDNNNEEEHKYDNSVCNKVRYIRDYLLIYRIIDIQIQIPRRIW